MNTGQHFTIFLNQLKIKTSIDRKHQLTMNIIFNSYTKNQIINNNNSWKKQKLIQL